MAVAEGVPEVPAPRLTVRVWVPFRLKLAAMVWSATTFVKV